MTKKREKIKKYQEPEIDFEGGIGIDLL